jgi:hypothetical protein
VLRPAIHGALALGALTILPRSAYPVQNAGGGPLRVQRAEIMDRRGFERPMVAYTLFVPAGWRGQGEVEYPQDNCGVNQRLNWSATAPDGIGAIQVIPEEKWSASSFPQDPDNCLHAPINNTRQYLEWWVQRNRPGARVLDYRPRPDLAAPFNRIAQQSNGMRSWGDGGEILIAYQVQGRSVRESISTANFFIHTQMPGMGGSQGLELLQGSSAPGFALRMPEGALDFKAAEALRQSIRSGPEWQQRMNQVMAERNRIAMDHNRRMGEINRQGAADRSAIIANTAREVNEIQMGTWQSRNQSMDRTQRETIESIRGVETYNDPHYGGTVQLSNQYQHAWQLRDGSYVLTDDPNFDPARLNLQGTKLRVTP